MKSNNSLPPIHCLVLDLHYDLNQSLLYSFQSNVEDTVLYNEYDGCKIVRNAFYGFKLHREQFASMPQKCYSSHRSIACSSILKY